LQAQFKQKRDPKKYRYDSSLSPELSWDMNAERERAEALIAKIREAKTLEEAKSAADVLAHLSKPFLNWTGKAERSEFTVPTLPLFVHERLSTKARMKAWICIQNTFYLISEWLYMLYSKYSIYLRFMYENIQGIYLMHKQR
jgi:hypothetical protein